MSNHFNFESSAPPDLLIVGAGPVGCVIAEQAATQNNWTSVIVEKRNHIAGNCYDEVHDSGVLIHKYGPHYFRTNNTQLLNYLSQYTEWVPGNYFVQSAFRNELFPFPINLNTLEQFYRKPLTPEEAKKLLDQEKSQIENPKNSEEFVLSKVGRKIYEAFYLGYTQKQWNKHPTELDPSICGRIPIRLNRDNRYVDHQFQVTPKHGFTELFKKMTLRNEIKILLKQNYKEIQKVLKPNIATVYCGPIDEYFEFSKGHLPWRSLNFDFKVFNKDFVQPCVQINYPNEHDYTRSVEIKHVTGQIHPKTVISYEYPTWKGDPYYPVLNPSSTELLKKYIEMADHETKSKSVYFSGRLATFKYINTDEAIEQALATFKKITFDSQMNTNKNILKKSA